MMTLTDEYSLWSNFRSGQILQNYEIATADDTGAGSYTCSVVIFTVTSEASDPSVITASGNLCGLFQICQKSKLVF